MSNTQLSPTTNDNNNSNQPQTCKNAIISPKLWEMFYPTVYQYLGFNRADGYLTIYDPTGAIVPAQYLPPFTMNPMPLNGCIFHQYFNAAGQMVGDLFLAGLAPIPILVTRQINNPVLGKGTVCQNFLYSALAPDLLTAYSEITPSGVGFMSSAYYSQNSDTLNQVFSNEIFSFDSNMVTSFSQTNTYTLGNDINTHYLSQTVYFRYTPITEAEAIAIGYDPANIMP